MAEPQQAPDPRERALEELKKKLVAHREAEARVKNLREEVKVVKKDYDKTEDDLKALQSVGQIIGEVLRQLDEERCEHKGWWPWLLLVAAAGGPDGWLMALPVLRCCHRRSACCIQLADVQCLLHLLLLAH